MLELIEDTEQGTFWNNRNPTREFGCIVNASMLNDRQWGILVRAIEEGNYSQIDTFRRDIGRRNS